LTGRLKLIVRAVFRNLRHMSESKMRPYKLKKNPNILYLRRYYIII
jgi:hypothetical protein